MGATPEQRAEVRRLRDAHLAKLHSMQAARQQLTANLTAGAKSNNNAQVCFEELIPSVVRCHCFAAHASLDLPSSNAVCRSSCLHSHLNIFQPGDKKCCFDKCAEGVSNCRAAG